MKEDHESYGMIGINRVSCNKSKNLFGSSINHSNTIMLKIKRAEKDRHLNRDWYFGRELLIEVEMSQNQFSEMITSMNIGDGVPCTLRHIQGVKNIEDPPELNQRQIFEKEFRGKIKIINEIYEKDLENIKDILSKKGPLNKVDRLVALETIDTLANIINDHIPFIQKSFNESMDKTVNEAKGEVEAFTQNRIMSYGLDKIKNEMKMIEGNDTETIDEENK